MYRRTFLRLSALAGAAGIAPASVAAPDPLGAPAPGRFRVGAFELEELTVPQLQQLMESGRTSAAKLAKRYLQRILDVDRHGPALNALIELNPDALSLAAALDRERKAKGPRGPLHGIPVLVKDNIDTHDRMSTTAGSLALAGSTPLRDAFLVEKLRAAGAVLLGKTNLSEWANFRGSLSTSGWSGRGGLTRNPYALDRNPSGSSSGSAVAVAANLCAVAVGTETDGSILSPSAYNGIVGIKPTLGLISRSGIIPIAHSQDTAGPMARTVGDAALLLGALAGTDPRDPATQESSERTQADYSRCLDAQALKGARLGVARSLFGYHPKTDTLIESCLEEMKQAGAELIDPIGAREVHDLAAAEIEVLRYEMKHDMNAYLASLGAHAPVRTLQDIIDFNNAHKEQELRWFGQEELVSSQAKPGLDDKPYLEALATCKRLARAEGIDKVMDEHRLDAIIAPTSAPAHVTDLVTGDHGLGDSTTLAAVAGYPSITVPAGQIFGLPVGISFFGRAWSEPRLLAIAFAFEQLTRARRAPRFLGTVTSQ